MRTHMTLAVMTLFAAGLLGWIAHPTMAQGPPLDELRKLKDELLYQRATQSYLWALPLLNMRAMKEASEKTFGAGYNVLPIWKKRMSAKTLVTTPNSDVIYAMGYLDAGTLEYARPDLSSSRP